MPQLLVRTLECSNYIIVTVTFSFGMILGQNEHVRKEGRQKKLGNPQLVDTKAR